MAKATLNALFPTVGGIIMSMLLVFSNSLNPANANSCLQMSLLDMLIV